MQSVRQKLLACTRLSDNEHSGVRVGSSLDHLQCKRQRRAVADDVGGKTAPPRVQIRRLVAVLHCLSIRSFAAGAGKPTVSLRDARGLKSLAALLDDELGEVETFHRLLAEMLDESSHDLVVDLHLGLFAHRLCDFEPREVPEDL